MHKTGINTQTVHDVHVCVHVQIKRVPIIPKLSHGGDSHYFDQYEELPKSMFEARNNVENLFEREFADF